MRDPVAEEFVAAIDYDFARFDGLPMLLGTVMRTSLFDRWVADFLAEHPTGTMVEIGTGLNTRYERADNGRARWFDLDLPDVIELRRTFFTDTPRRTMIAASVTDKARADTVAAHSGGPYLFAAEAVLPYLEERDVRDVIGCSPTASPAPCWPSTPPAPATSTPRTSPTRWARSTPGCSGAVPIRHSSPSGDRESKYWPPTRSATFLPRCTTNSRPMSRRCSAASSPSDFPRSRTTG
jgi:hypothetical protein